MYTQRLCSADWVKTYDKTVTKTRSRVAILREKQRTPRQIIHWKIVSHHKQRRKVKDIRKYGCYENVK